MNNEKWTTPSAQFNVTYESINGYLIIGDILNSCNVLKYLSYDESKHCHLVLLLWFGLSCETNCSLTFRINVIKITGRTKGGFYLPWRSQLKARSVGVVRVAVELQLRAGLLAVSRRRTDRTWNQTVTLSHTEDRSSALWWRIRRAGSKCPSAKCSDTQHQKKSSSNDISKCCDCAISLLQTSYEPFRPKICNLHKSRHVIICNWRITAGDEAQNALFTVFTASKTSNV